MAVEVIMPKAGMAMEEGTVVRWLKKEGDRVEAGEPLLEITTDKVNMELEASASGVLLKIIKNDGEVVPVTHVIGYIGEPGEKIEEKPPEALKPADAENAEAKPGDTASVDDGQALSGVRPVNQDGKVAATPLARVLAKEKGIDLKTVKATGFHGEVKVRDVEGLRKVMATPLAERIAADKGIDLSTIEGSGFGGKIRKEDLPQRAGPAAAYDAGQGSTAQAVKKPLKGIRKVIADRMLKSHLEIPPVTLNTKADVTELLELRKRLNETSSIKISINDFILKASAIALSEAPYINASIEGSEIVYKPYINVGMAVALEEGLIVPVIRNAERMSLKQIAARAKELSAKAREGKLLPDEYTGGTFTVSNLGMYGITSFTPIINQPESAILGVCAIEEELKMIGEKIVKRSVMGLSLTFDHRVVDGAQGAIFLNRIKFLLENPLEILV